MNQLTTIASLPSGAGAKSALPAEVGRAPEPKQASSDGAAAALGLGTLWGFMMASLARTSGPVVVNNTIGDVASASMVKHALAASAARGKDSRESDPHKWISVGTFRDGKFIPNDRLKESLASQVPINDEYVAPLGSQKAVSTDKLDEETLARIERIRKSLGWC